MVQVIPLQGQSLPKGPGLLKPGLPEALTTFFCVRAPVVSESVET